MGKRRVYDEERRVSGQRELANVFGGVVEEGPIGGESGDGGGGNGGEVRATEGLWTYAFFCRRRVIISNEVDRTNLAHSYSTATNVHS